MDKISSLPDPILCHILSFLPTQISGRTSVLARRWRFLWTYVRKLDFDKSDCGSESKLSFADMVYRVLLLHNGSIDSFRIFSDGGDSNCQIDAWVSTAIARNVQILYLSHVWLPPCCFKCQSLVEFTIHYSSISVKSGAVCLPRLEKLTLFCNYYENDESLPNLVSGCSVLEYMCIDREVCDNMNRCYVCSSTLKSFITSGFLCCELDHEHKLVLDIPAVQYLEIGDQYSPIIGAKMLSSLVVADIYFYNDFEEKSRDVFQFVEKLSNAKRLKFTSGNPMNLLNPTFSFPTMRFHNLTRLDFTVDWRLLTEFLECANKLESLTIGEVKEELKFWREPKHLPKCLSSSLKYVSILGFAGGKHELTLARFILRHAKVLETIKIYSESSVADAHSELVMLKKISEFPRGSPKCGLTFI
ncbi:F-box/FBD/LRR-repeat protein At5g56420-like [Henckelia pumila]|uniref:F-box/FBD/LRR-repeat protein At5g56420-like n=1 Tax=Henckelia pumila TaxID=405737 RepID=UPI003C6E7066